MTAPLPIKEAIALLIGSFIDQERPEAGRRAHARAIQILQTNFPSSNDFTTRERFAGLEEKCRILNNDELADALALRYDALEPWSSPWKFSVISLLLQLADDPINKTRLEDLIDLIPPPLPPDPTWSDLLKDDPYDDEDIWKTIDYAESTSGESELSLEPSERTEEQSELSILGEDPINSRLTSIDNKLFQIILYARKNYARADPTGCISLTETQLLRETLFMLHGLPNAVYFEDDSILQAKQCSILGLTPDVTHRVIESFCEIGKVLATIRGYATKQHHNPVLQAFQACVSYLLYEFDAQLSELEEGIHTQSTSSSTLLSILNEVEAFSRTLTLIGLLVDCRSRFQEAHQVLQDLFELVSDQQSLDNNEQYQQLGRVFFRCLQVYLRPIKLWIEEGFLEEGQFFVRRSTVLTNRLWQDQFHLDIDSEGAIRAPEFLQPLVNKIFVAGKGLNLLQALDPSDNLQPRSYGPELDFDSMHSSALDLEPFQEVFGRALTNWIHSRCCTSEVLVLQTVLKRSDLLQVLSDIQHVFFLKNGAIAQRITSDICDRIDRQKRWKDMFYLTDLFQEHFKQVPRLNTEDITIRINTDLDNTDPRSIQALDSIHVDYRLSWAAMLVIQPEHIVILQNIFSLLLKLHRASQLLNKRTKIGMSPDAIVLKILSLQQRLRWFVSTLQAYISIGVLEPLMQRLQAAIPRSKDLDELIRIFHNTVLEMESSCALAASQREIKDILISMLDIVVLSTNLSNSSSNSNLIRLNEEAFDDSDHSDVDDVSQQRTSSRLLLRNSSNLWDGYSIKFDQLLDFAIAKLREMTRSSKESLLQILLENLQFGSQRT